MSKIKQELDNLNRKDLLVFRDNLVKYLYDLKTDDTHRIISEVYRLITELSDRMK